MLQFVVPTVNHDAPIVLEALIMQATRKLHATESIAKAVTRISIKSFDSHIPGYSREPKISPYIGLPLVPLGDDLCPTYSGRAHDEKTDQDHSPIIDL